MGTLLSAEFKMVQKSATDELRMTANKKKQKYIKHVGRLKSKSE